VKDRPIVAIDGSALRAGAAVAAVDEATAQAAVATSWWSTPNCRSWARSRSPGAGATLVHDQPIRPGLFHGLGTLPPRDGNICYSYAIERGDVASVFETADIVVEGEYTFPGVYQYAMETHS
jgi:CO/xanthine dehydrogenase Mo-binding subunit